MSTRKAGVDGLFLSDDDTSAAHRELDWSATPLGPVQQWPPELHAAVRTVMPSRIPMLLWWGPDLVQIFNHAYAAAIGDKYPAAIGQLGAECWPEVWDHLGPLSAGVLAGGEATYSDNQLLFVRRHGYLEETYWTFSFSPVHGPNGEVLGVFVTTSDATPQVLADRRLETLRRLGTLSIAEADTPVDVCRAAVEVLAGATADLTAVAAYLGDTEPVAGAAGQADVVAEVIATGVPRHTPDQRVYPLVDRSAVVGALVLGMSPYREVDDAYATFADLVAEMVGSAVGDAIAYAAERDRARALAELDAAKTRFFQNVSHEFRTPLTLLEAPIEVVAQEAALTPAHRDALDAALRAARRLGRLVDALLDVTKAQAGTLRARPEPVDVGAITGQCAAMLRSAAEGAGLDFTVHAEPAVALLDPEMWSHVVLNLVSNAIKFTRAGSVAVRLRVAGGNLVLAVADTGVGIPEAEQVRVFERFHQVAGTTGRSREGAGIGLALVEELVGVLGGTVGLSSVPGVGSTFTVTVPHTATDAAPGVRPVAEIGAAFVAEARQWQPPAALSGDRAGGQRILLVEDNADLRDYLIRLLHAEDWAVTAVGDAGAAIAAVRADRPDLVLSDVMLPGRDGLELLGEIRADPGLARLPVILLTARAGAESTADGLRHGADDYVVKPFHPAELVARVRVHLELAQSREGAIAHGERRAANLDVALRTRTAIGQAVGILMVTQRCDADTAFDRLVAASQRRNVKLREVADDLVRQVAASHTARSVASR
ncbi:response regulator [Actinokineospora guangxiensis]|uniref:histidine kinase n=1 Tax=Actinokineospora guangxiensis TaxID=1490288 RepID=A0ABW0ETA7_9PSEU